MKLKLNHCDSLGDWYTIERAEHDGREWDEEVEEDCYRFMMSARLSPEACIEGDSREMRVVAHAIERRGSASFKRIAVRFESGEFYFRSPKNSDHEVAIPVEDADDLAAQIFAELGEETP